MAMITGKVQLSSSEPSKNIEVGEAFARKTKKKNLWKTVTGEELIEKSVNKEDLLRKIRALKKPA